MTQGYSLEELEENLKDACLLMAMDDVPENHQSSPFPGDQTYSIVSDPAGKIAI
jgi:predicted RNase H-like HicB family nuclease